MPSQQREVLQLRQAAALTPPMPVQPLCYELYYRLKGVAARRGLGDVLIANEGELIYGYPVSDVTYGTRFEVGSWGETYRINCLFCNDTRNRLWIPYVYGQPDRNDENKPGPPCGVCFNEDCLKDPDNRETLWEEIFKLRTRHLRGQTPQIDHARGVQHSGQLSETTLPGFCVPLSELPANDYALQWLTAERRFHRQHWDHYGLTLCAGSDEYPAMPERIVIPIYQHGVLVGWQGRYVGDPPNKRVPKYYTKPGFKKTWALYNYDRAKAYDFVVVFEGVTDVWRLGDCSTAILGKEISPAQQRLLEYQWGGKNQVVIICLDPEAIENSKGAIHMLLLHGVNVVRVQLPPGADPADYTDRQVLWNIIRQQVEARGITNLPAVI